MSTNARPALVTTVHDPEGRLGTFLETHGDGFKAYGSVFACVTEHTDPLLTAALQNFGARVHIGPAGAAGESQRRALRAAIEAGFSECFVCDLDRWLHWSMTYAEELTGLAHRLSHDHPDAWYVCLGRTARAMDTHPVTQILPETMTNRALSSLAGIALDATAGAAWIRTPAATLILDRSTEASKATDLEWPGLVLGADRSRLAGMTFDGLEFETADVNVHEIAASGSLEDWLQATYDQPRVIRERLHLAAESVAALIRVTGEPNG